jgi:hypothetical protein
MPVNWGINEFKKSFFDADAVKKKLDAGIRRVLSKAGAFVRTRARSSIRKRKKVSDPGQPPSSHEGSLKRLIFFAYDAGAQSVVTGPVRFGKGTAPQLLEFGGDALRVYKSGRSKRQRYRARPFMKPAGEAELPKFRDLLRNLVR